MKEFYYYSHLLEQKLLHAIYFIFGEIDFSPFTATQIILDIALFTLIIYLILRFIVRIHAFQILITVLIFAIVLFISKSLHLIASQLILQGIFILLLISLPIMFQNEIRQMFEKLGSSPLLFFQKSKENARHKLIKIIKHASDILSKKRHGALIVIEQSSPLYVYAETGLMLGAKISKELLLNIFFPKSPLHDGAVIIKQNTIVSAGSVLPFTHSVSEYIYGTRHKSAIGIAEITDAITIVVSEERGSISIAHNGKLIPNVKPEYLEHYLEKNLQ